MTNWDFACSDPVDISVDSWGSGSIVVSGEPTSAVTVEVVPSHRRADVDGLLDQVQVAFEDGQLYIRGPRVATFRRKQGLDLTIKAPAGSSCAAKTVSADLSCVGEISAVSLQTASGDLTAASVGGRRRCGRRAATCCSTGPAGTAVDPHSLRRCPGDAGRRRHPDHHGQRRRHHRLLRRPCRRAHRERRREARPRSPQAGSSWPARLATRRRRRARDRRLPGPGEQLG